MTSCSHCGERATLEIPSIPGQVCIAHALEFWSGLLTYAKDQAQPTEQIELSVDVPLTDEMWRDLPRQ
jgi:hypothetical protein